MRTIIESNSKSILDLREIFRFKDLLWNLSKRDVLVRYKQTFIGVVWAIIRPLINIVIFGFLSQFIEQTDNMAERFIQVSAGMVIWGLISTSVTDISNSIVSNSSILTKVYFPKLIIPISSLTVCLIDFFISFVILVILKISLIGMPGPEFFLFPLFLIYALVFGLSIGLFFATLNVKYRDVKLLVPFLIQIGFYACPVFLSTSFYLEKLPESLKPIFLSNPLVGVIEGFKYAFLGQPMQISPLYFGIGVVITLLLMIFSLRYFVKFEKTFADFI
ncbi:MAG: ABC transporter permease [Sphingobacteriaceae bacterium]